MLLLLCQLAIQASNYPYRRVLDNRIEEVLTVHMCAFFLLIVLVNLINGAPSATSQADLNTLTGLAMVTHFIGIALLCAIVLWHVMLYSQANLFAWTRTMSKAHATFRSFAMACGCCCCCARRVRPNSTALACDDDDDLEEDVYPAEEWSRRRPYPIKAG